MLLREEIRTLPKPPDREKRRKFNLAFTIVDQALRDSEELFVAYGEGTEHPGPNSSLTKARNKSSMP